ncbi:MAG: dTDP-4-dehydrorhamnose 3,5-epimerase [bacterium]|jgi:dTDP-4-dehydrorhamnose 3,5-epimerase|nr:dTDP-4-dehydrorhamnose 3,5-epimerase [bacterium]MDD3624350.1 dTDP-4-dehydrorhamnose 3,5-epimerase [Proteiniphilum sp.]MDD3968883.1 dTDP-4-dehydrorhamnose 3,5-epimerase [Proteiniphilum sp.]MDD4458442.1 dTDP-4-dehydrorhamnose 3,5-epimerase [Proteiniphilum sp.]
MNILKTNIDGVLLIEPKVFVDERGYFFESYSQREFEKKVCKVLFVQDNESKSRYGVVRGLHYQRAPYEQSKLVRVVSGRVLDVAVDIRPDSPTYGEHVATVLSDENKRQLFIPRGFAHGFAVLSDVALFQYKCDNYYAPGYEAAIRWDDPKLAIDWMLPLKDIILSEKDKNSPLL